MKSVQIRSFSGPYFSVFGMNTEIFRIQKNTDLKKTPYLDKFHAVYNFATELEQFYHVNKNNSQSESTIDTLNPFLVNVLFLHPLKTSENLWFSNIFRGYRNGTLLWNGLKNVHDCLLT